jgi:hypothetical protein
LTIHVNIWQIFVNFGWYSFKSLVWSCNVDYGPLIPDGYVVKRIFVCLLNGESLITPRASPCFSQASSVAFHGSVFLNHSQNAVITFFPYVVSCAPTHLHLATFQLNNCLYQP